jgi:hypothetical protein
MIDCILKFIGLRHITQCTHCGREGKMHEVSSYYAAFAPPVKFPAKNSIHENHLCDICWAKTLDQYFGHDRFVQLARDAGLIAENQPATFEEIARSKMNSEAGQNDRFR